MQFIANLRQETIDSFARRKIQPAGYLLSTHRLTPATLARAHAMADLGIRLFADNGTKPLIEHTVATFEPEVAPMRAAVRVLRRKIGHAPRGAEIPKALRRRAADLAERVVAAATARSDAIDGDALIAEQASLRATDLIAQEDFATACLIALGLDRELTGWSIAKVDRRNRRSLALWRRVTDDPRCRGRHVHAVLSAMDYNTARSAGALAAEAGANRIALGFAGINGDASATDFFVLGHAGFALDRPAPRRYVRAAQILRGVADGFRDEGRRLRGFHALGLGAPPLFPVLAAAFTDGVALSADATSPIHDAVRDRVLYHPERDGDRETAVAIVAHIVGGGRWPLASPFARGFAKRFGHSERAARAWWTDAGEPEIARDHLRSPSALTTALPLFCEVLPDSAGEAQRTWIAHNHWVLGTLAATYPATPGRARRALARINTLQGVESLTTARGLAAARRVLTGR